MGPPLRRYYEGLLLLLLAVAFCTLASTGRLAWPVATLAAAAYLAQGYAWAVRRRLRLPARWLLIALALYLPVYVLDAFFLSGGFLDATLHLAVLAAAAKLLAAATPRDDLVLGLLAFLEVAAAALVTVSGLFFVLFLLFLGLLIATLVAHEMAAAQAAAGAPPDPAGAPPARAVPLLRFSLLLSLGVGAFSVLLFFLLPRTTLGAWSSHRPATGLSGFSDEVRLGAIASLQRTDNPVMHIRITSSDPALGPAAFQQIRWRGRGLTSFDGRRWFTSTPPALYATQAGRLEVSPLSLRDPPEIVRYQVTLEPLASPVLFFPAQLLRAATRYPVLSWDGATATLASAGETASDDGADNAVLADGGFDGTSYAGVSNLARPSPAELRAAPGLDPERLRFALRADLQLPDDLDPRIRALARSLTAHGPADAYDRMQALAAYLQSHYQYSLDDLPQGADPLASFLFDQQSGDCEYFASALAVMARSIGIPTRVVNGFMAGTYNPLSGEYIVRGRDAHSWVEAYFPLPDGYRGRGYGRGGYERGVWVSFDATPADTGEAAGVWPGMMLDALSSFWQEWIVNYDWLQQAGLARSLQSTVGDRANRAWEAGSDAAVAAWHALALAPARLAGGVALGLAAWVWPAAGCALLLLLAGWSWRRGWHFRRSSRAAVADAWAAQRARLAYRRFQRCLERAGHPRAPAQTAQELLAAVAAAHPEAPLARSAAGFVAAYEALRFGAAPATPHALLAARAAALDRLLATVRRDCAHSSL